MRQEHLELFHAVAESGSITAGGQRLHLSQPAASKRLADLERSLGQRLVDRLPKRGVRLTPAGELLHAYTQRLGALLAQAERSLRGMANLESGRLAIGASSTIGTYLIPAAIATFRRNYPGIALDLRIGNSDAMLALLCDGRIDLACTEDDRRDLGDDVCIDPLGVDELVIICRPGHPLLEHPNLRATDLVRHPFILREPGSGTRTVFERALAQRGLHLEPDLVLGANEAVKLAVAHGDHCAPISGLAVAQELDTGVLARLDVADLTMHRELHRLRLRWRSEDLALRAFIGTLQAQSKRLRPDGPAATRAVASPGDGGTGR